MKTNEAVNGEWQMARETAAQAATLAREAADAAGEVLAIPGCSTPATRRAVAEAKAHATAAEEFNRGTWDASELAQAQAAVLGALGASREAAAAARRAVSAAWPV